MTEDNILDGFEVFNGYRRRYNDLPEMLIKKNGTFSLNSKAYKLLAEPQNVTLFYHREKRIIGIRPGVNIPVQQKERTYLIAGNSFLKHYGIESTGSRRYSVILEDGMLIIDLNQEIKKRVEEEEQL